MKRPCSLQSREEQLIGLGGGGVDSHSHSARLVINGTRAEMEALGWRRGRLRDREEGGRWGRWSSRPPVEPAHPSTHHTFLVPPLSAATPVCVVPGTQLAAHDRRPGNSRPISRRMRVILARAHLQPAGALQPSAAKPFQSNITFWTLGLSSLALRVLAGISDGCQSANSDTLPDRVPRGF